VTEEEINLAQSLLKEYGNNFKISPTTRYGLSVTCEYPTGGTRTFFSLDAVQLTHRMRAEGKLKDPCRPSESEILGKENTVRLHVPRKIVRTFLKKAGLPDTVENVRKFTDDLASTFEELRKKGPVKTKTQKSGALVYRPGRSALGLPGRVELYVLPEQRGPVLVRIKAREKQGDRNVE